MLSFALSSDLAAIVRPGLVAFAGVTLADPDPRLDVPLAEAERRVRSTPPAESAAVRAMYRKVGIDPTKRRPSSEALLRRVRRGEGLPRINTLVDICNWCSLEFQLPYGLYDLDHVQGGIELRLGQAGEQYAGIRKDVVHVADRLTLADALGPFGNPTSDSARTMVTASTVNAVAVVFAPREIPLGRLSAVLDTTAERILSYAGGTQTARLVV